MRTIDEIMACKRLMIGEMSYDGLSGEIQMPTWKGTIIVSWGSGWEHCSVSPYKKRITPDWDDMCMIKDIIFKEDEAVIQIHPPKNEYVNNMPNCLHLWRPIDKKLVLPPSFMVGLRKGQTMEEVNQEIKRYNKENGYE